MIRVAITRYPRGGELTNWFWMPEAPRRGETIHLPAEFDEPAGEVAFVSWVQDDDPQGSWHVEISIR